MFPTDEEKKVIKKTPKAKKADGLKVSIDLTTKEKNNEELRKGRVTEYSVKESEKGFIHVELENTIFRNGEKTSTPMVQLYEPNAWHSYVRKNILSSGYSHVRILYAPDGVNTELVSIEPKK